MLFDRNLPAFAMLASTAIVAALGGNAAHASDLTMDDLNDIGISADIKEKRLVDNKALKIAKSLASFPNKKSPAYTLLKKRIYRDAIKVTAADYASYNKQHRDNPKYVNKELIVSGRVQQSGDDGFGIAYMILEGDDESKGTLAHFTADSPTTQFLATVKKRDTVNLFCHGSTITDTYDARIVYCQPLSIRIKWELNRLGKVLLNYNKAPIAIPALYAYQHYNIHSGKYTEAALLMSRARKAQTLGVECPKVSQACADQANKALATVIQHDTKVIYQEMFRAANEMDEEKLDAAVRNI